MSTAIIDARGWQNSFDLRTGEKVTAETPAASMLKKILQAHPYPGDLDRESNRWVTDTAYDLISRYSPEFVILTYAAQYFSGRYKTMTPAERERMIADAFLEVRRFAEISGFFCIIIGTGDMTPVLGYVDLTALDGLAVSTNWSTKYAGLYEPSGKDLEFLNSHPHIEKIVSHEEIIRLFNGTPEQAKRVPEFLILAGKGYTFKSLSPALKVPVMIPSDNFTIPLHFPGYEGHDITGIRAALETTVSVKNTALIFMEGIGLNGFLLPFTSCDNGKEWFFYETGDAQYLTVSSGRHRFFDYPKGYKYYDEVDANNEYPFSGYFKSIPGDTFADSFEGRSIAVGNKSMFMHMVTGADISIECFSRNMFNQGTMAVIHREDKV